MKLYAVNECYSDDAGISFYLKGVFSSHDKAEASIKQIGGASLLYQKSSGRWYFSFGEPDTSWYEIVEITLDEVID